jgi:polyferredoxin
MTPPKPKNPSNASVTPRKSLSRGHLSENNQGIKLSRQNSFAVFLVSSLTVGLTVWLIVEPIIWLNTKPSGGLIFELKAALIAGLTIGLIAGPIVGLNRRWISRD